VRASAVKVAFIQSTGISHSANVLWTKKYRIMPVSCTLGIITAYVFCLHESLPLHVLVLWLNFWIMKEGAVDTLDRKTPHGLGVR
jgi:hypothetical protein